MAFITSEQIRAARAIIRLTVADLSTKSGVGIATIKRMEAAPGMPSAHVKTLSQIQFTLEKMGVEFIGTPEDGPGVRLVNKKNPKDSY